MKHVVIIPDGVASKRISAVEMARRLRSAGYRITFIGKGGDYTQIDDFDYLRLDLELHMLVPGSSSASAEPYGSGKSSGNIPKSMEKQAGDPKVAHVNSFHSLLKKLSPDLLLIDIEAHVFVLAALAMNIPVALFSVFFNLRKYPSMPPLHTDIIPGRGLTGHSIIIELAWIRFRISKLVSNMRDKIKSGGKDRVSLFSNHARKLGLRLADHVEYYQWLIPFLYRELPVLVLNPKEMEFPFRPHHTTSYVGPMICTDRSCLPFLPGRGKQASDSKKLLDSYRKRQDKRRLIYCSFGSFFKGDDKTFWLKLVEAFKDTGWDVIFALGNRLNPDSLGEMPENIHCLKFAPQMDIMPVADCAIIHAGMTTVYECVRYEVPMVIYPFKVNDQMGTAARAVYHKIAISGSRGKDSPEDIRGHVEQAMSDQEMLRNISRMRQHITSYEENNAVAGAVDQIFEVVR